MTKSSVKNRDKFFDMFVLFNEEVVDTLKLISKLNLISEKYFDTIRSILIEFDRVKLLDDYLFDACESCMIRLDMDVCNKEVLQTVRFLIGLGTNVYGYPHVITQLDDKINVAKYTFDKYYDIWTSSSKQNKQKHVDNIGMLCCAFCYFRSVLHYIEEYDTE